MNTKKKSSTRRKPDKEPLTLADLLQRTDLAPGTRKQLQALTSTYPPRSFKEREQAEIDFICEVIYGASSSDNELPSPAVSIVRNYLQDMAESYDLYPWTDPSVARAMYGIVVELQSGGLVSAPTMVFQGLRSAVKTLCSAKEYAAFLVEGKLTDEDAPPTAEEADYEYTMKAARILANPQTSVETRHEIENALLELSMSTQTQVYHPALVERALTVMLERVEMAFKGVGGIRERRRDRQDLFAILDSIEE